MRLGIFLKKIKPYKVFKLRRRYLFTRTNTLRLRYTTAGIFGFATLAALILGLPSPSLALKHPYFLDRSEKQISEPTRTAAEGLLTPLRLISPEKKNEESLQNQISGAIRTAAQALKKPEQPKFREITISQGDTIAGLLQKSGLSGRDAYHIVQTLGKHFDPRKVKSGQKIGLYFENDDTDTLRFAKMTMKLTPIKEIQIIKESEENFVSRLEEKALVKHSYGRFIDIQTSLYGSAAQAGIPQQVIAEIIRIYSWNVDFQRDIRQGDKLEVLYDTYETENGEFAHHGDVLYANLTVGGKDVPVYRFEMNDGRTDYFEPNGRSIRKTLMKTPIDGARVSSGFGMRKHPVLGYNKMHKGVDFAAPTGTPIYAAGDGIVEHAGRNGGYGNYIRIRHNSRLKTAYAHLHKIKKGIANGKHVEQGQIIGYVGTTGRSTGPHLHYEVLVNGKQTNPRSVNLPTGEQLTGKDLDRFKGVAEALKQQYIALTEKVRFAQNNNTAQNPVR